PAPAQRAPTARRPTSRSPPNSRRCTCNGRPARSGRLLRHPQGGVAAAGADRAAVLRGAGLRQLRPAHAGEAPRPGADGLPHLLPRAAGSALRRARRVPLLLKAPAARRGHRVHDDAPGSRNTNRDRTRYDTTTTTAPEATK